MHKDRKRVNAQRPHADVTGVVVDVARLKAHGLGIGKRGVQRALDLASKGHIALRVGLHAGYAYPARKRLLHFVLELVNDDAQVLQFDVPPLF